MGTSDGRRMDFSRLKPFKDARTQAEEEAELRRWQHDFRMKSYGRIGWDSSIDSSAGLMPRQTAWTEHAPEPEFTYRLTIQEALGNFRFGFDDYSVIDDIFDTVGDFKDCWKTKTSLPDGVEKTLEAAKSVIGPYMDSKQLDVDLARTFYAKTGYIIPSDLDRQHGVFRADNIVRYEQDIYDMSIPEPDPEYVTLVMFDDPNNCRRICQLIRHMDPIYAGSFYTEVLRVDMFHDTKRGPHHTKVYES